MPRNIPWSLSSATFGGILLVGAILLTGRSSDSALQDEKPATRDELLATYREGNYRDAFEGLRPRITDAATPVDEVISDLPLAVQALQQLGRVSEIDALLEDTVEAHRDSWRVLWTVSQQFLSVPMNGVLIGGEFERGPHRGGGHAVNSVERDRVRSLQLMAEAIPLAQESDDKAAAAGFFLSLSDHLLSHRGYGGAWRLQTLTDLEGELPDYAEGYYYWQPPVGAPVDEEGQPLFHRPSETWEAATTDGERWRWALEQAGEYQPSNLNNVRYRLASFYHQQLGVQTLQNSLGPYWGRRGADQEQQDAQAGVYDVHTLTENETIARLASGIQRLELPEEFNFIKIFQTIVAEPRTGYASTALDTLAQIFENRRQYPRAAEYWRTAIEQHGDSSWRTQRLSQIVDNWGQFEGESTQPAGKGASLQFRFRNARKTTFTAYEVKVEELLGDVKQYLKSDPAQLDWNKLNVEQMGWRLIQLQENRYVGRRVARWEEELDPRENHWDRRVEIGTPLRRAGAYLVTAEVEQGNTSRIVVWVADTAIVQNSLSGGTMYFVSDAVSGEPVAGANVEFFGYRVFYDQKNNRQQVTTTNFADRTNENGILIPQNEELKTDHQYLVVARSREGRLAYLGFSSVWTNNYHLPTYEQLKAFCITDRPVYRPGHKVSFKFWVRKADYGDDGDVAAGQNHSIQVIDPKGDVLQTFAVRTDKFGGVDGEWELPADATLGEYQLRLSHIDSGTFRVEEYKKPEYEVTIDAPTKPVQLGEKIEATIRAKYYFGSPVTNATVKFKITRETHHAQWYPWAAWDWCYGPGYWWFAYDYMWYPGWARWVGCERPYPIWAPWSPLPPEVVLEQEVPIGSDGTVPVVIDTALARALHGDKDHQYTITAEVRDQSRRTIVGRGEVLVARQPFQVYTWLGRGYYRVGNTIEASFQAQTLDQRPVQGTGKVTLYSVSYDEDRQPIETMVREWNLDTDEEGDARLKFQASQKGQYRLSYEVDDGAGHVIEGGYLFTVIGAGFDGREFRYNALELIPDQAEYAPGDRVRLQINTDHIGATVLLFLRPVEGAYQPPVVLKLRGKSTIYQLPVAQRDMPNFFVEAVTVFDGEVHRQAKEIVVPPEKRVLNVDVVADAQEYRPGEEAKIKLHVTDFFGENFVGSTVVTVYDKSVEYISGGSNVRDIKDYFWKWRRNHYPLGRDNLQRAEWPQTPSGETGMQMLGVFGGTVADRQDVGRMARGASQANAPALKSMFFADAPAEAEGMALSAMGGDYAESRDENGAPVVGQSPLAEPTVRQNFADTALWVGELTTDDEGFAEVSLKMPENLTTWKVRVWGMGAGARVGEGETEVVTTKNLILRLQAPRFAVQTDEMVLSANVHNYLESEKPVTVRMELPDDHLQLLDEAERQITIAAGGEQRVDWRVRVVREGVTTIRMLALTDEESDAMQVELPCYVHGILKMESWAGSVRPEQDKAELTIRVPAERRPEDTRLEIRYSPTLAAAMLDALPYLADYPYGCTEQTLNRFLPSVITQNILLEMNVSLDEIREKRTNLNAQELGDDQERARQWRSHGWNPVFDPDELQKIVRAGVQRLTEMQLSDGGWGWFSGWGESSYPHTTAVVVRGLRLAQENDVAIVPGVLENGIAWLERHQNEQVRLLQAKAEQASSYRHYAHNLDALVYLTLVENGKDNLEMREFLDRDRTNLSVYGKALFGLALHLQGDEERLTEVMKNLEQYLVQDEENETAYLHAPGSSWWYWYGDDIEANAIYLKLLARVEPQGVVAPRLVKYLLNNRKHATYWKSTRDTALCVEAFSDYLLATGETQPDMVVEVWIDGERRKEVSITSENLFSFDNQFVLEGAELTDGEHVVELRRRGTGPVYFNAYLTNFTLEDPITAAGLEVKVERNYYRLVPKEKQIQVPGARGQAVSQRVEAYDRVALNNLDEVASGDLVEVDLMIESKNDYEYILFEDRKPAGFEAVEVRSGYTENGLRAYTEYRDERVSFFVQYLARGRHSISYRLRAETPGRFSALPATATGMYAPELAGNSDELKLRVIE